MSILGTSARMERIRPSATIMVTMKAMELRAAGRDIVSLSAGEPDFDTPAHIRDAAITAIEDGQTRYTAVDGTPEVVRDGHTGFLVPPEDAAALARAVIRFFDEDCARDFAAGVAAEKEKYSWDRMARDYETVLERAAGART